MEGASSTSSQHTMNLKFSSQISKNSNLVVKDSSENILLTFNPSSSGFVENIDIRTYQGAILSHPSFKLNEVYYLYLDDTQLGYNGQRGQNMPGNPPVNNSNNNPGNPPDNGGQNNNNDNPGTPPDNEGQNNNNDNPGTPPNNGGNNNNQSTNTGSMSKKFTLTSTATTFNGVSVYSESNYSNNSGSYIKTFGYLFGFLGILLLFLILIK